MYSGKEGAFVLKMIRWHRQKKNNGSRNKRIASAVCMLGVLVVCLGVVGYRNKLKADEKLPVMTRGVVDQIEQIPESKRNIYDANAAAAKLGTRENPFLILEIVPYEEYAEFGYQISGCEPVNVEDMRYGNADINTVKTITGAKCEMKTAYFFPDEPEGDISKYSGNMRVCEDGMKDAEYTGYYERVKDGEGTFVQKIVKGEDGNESLSFVRQDHGNIIWHTVNDFEKSDDKDQTFDEKTDRELTNEGDRIYTKRKSTGDKSKDNINVTNNYYLYKNNDYFLKDSIGCKTQEEADNYSVIIKTITPEELNAQPKWADYADLYVVSPKMHSGEDNIRTIWKRHNRYGKHSSVSSYTNGFNGSKDISWDVVTKMYKKINQEENYAPIFMDSGVYIATQGSLSGGKPVTFHILDWNMNPTIYTYKDTGYNNNMYKLAVMLFSMDAQLFQRLYLDGGEDALIQVEKIDGVETGVFTAQTGDARAYWSKFTFLPSDVDGRVIGENWYHYWTKLDKWETYKTAGEITSDENQGYLNGRMFVFKGDKTSTQDFGTGTVPASDPKSKFTDFKEFTGNDPKATPADAVRYILGYKTSKDHVDGELRILDIEPCYDRKNGYSLKKSYIQLMIPNFIGDIKITHMTTAEFIGSTEDLNSKYNMIYLGLDQGAYNLVEKDVTYKDADGNVKWIKENQTVWNDTSMNGKIYFHTGDKMTSAEYSRSDGISRSVKFLWAGSGNNVIEDTTLRFPGNDITKIKKAELENFLHAGYPVVAVDDLYCLSDKIDAGSNLADLVRESKKEKKTIYQTSDSNGLIAKVKEVCPKITFTKLPNEYQGTTSSGGKNDTSVSVDDSQANYLDVDGFGRSKLDFGFQVTDVPSAQYQCKVYIDQNQDGKFEEGLADVDGSGDADDSDDTGEVYYEGDVFTAGDGEQNITPVKLSKLYFGLIQWKIVVYRKDNPDIHFTRTGCSVAKNQTGQKREIKVLQIMPDTDTNNKGYLNLHENTLFTKYYNALNDYNITVVTTTVSKFQENYFGEKFVYDYSRDISAQKGNENPVKMSTKQKELYHTYNMFILGFGDTFHKVNMSNKNGAIDFLKYFIASGKSVLFTHDFTSMHNVNSGDFGYSANTYLRDVMGMNRYKAVSGKLTESERKELLAYQAKHKYDTMTQTTVGSDGTLSTTALGNTQGFTYYAMKRLGWEKKNTDQIIPYRYMIRSYKNDEYICGVSNDNVKLTGFNNNNDLTTRATKTNTGQITEYPFKIDETLKIASTHGQWYQLDMEDPEVTVWYCLSDNENGDPCAWAGTASNGDGTGATYGASPNDAANNYYIYSKGNVFYSGVGHSTVDGDMEAKLFINTMIAAYRTTYEPPMVEILNEEAELLKEESGNGSDPNLVYKMNWMKEYGNNLDGTKEKIRFSPVELNTVRTKLTCSIQYKDGTYVDKIYKKDGTVIEGKATKENPKKYVFENLKNMSEYYFIYDTTGENKKKEGDIFFEIYNNKSKNPDGTPRVGKTTVKMESQNLFLLD